MRTRQDAMREIATAIEAGDAKASEYDLEMVCDACYRWDERDGYVCTADEAEFWKAVESAAWGASA